MKWLIIAIVLTPISVHAVEMDDSSMRESYSIPSTLFRGNTIHIIGANNQQIAEFNELKRERVEQARERREFVEEMNMTKEERVIFYKDYKARQSEALMARIEEILLPHQIEHLRRLTLVYRYEAKGLSGLLASGDISPSIRNMNLSGDQLEKLGDAAKEAEVRFRNEEVKLHAEYEAKLRELRREMLEEVIEPLTERQKEVLREILSNQDFD